MHASLLYCIDVFGSGQHCLQSMLRDSVVVVQCYYSHASAVLSTGTVSILANKVCLGPLSDTEERYNRTVCINMKGSLPYELGQLQASFLLGTSPDQC